MRALGALVAFVLVNIVIWHLASEHSRRTPAPAVAAGPIGYGHVRHAEPTTVRLPAVSPSAVASVDHP